jgi:hypothetical protein
MEGGDHLEDHDQDRRSGHFDIEVGLTIDRGGKL